MSEEKFENSMFTTLNQYEDTWWLEVKTETPKWSYYIGPFATQQLAIGALYRYIEALKAQGAQGIQWEIEQRA